MNLLECLTMSVGNLRSNNGSRYGSNLAYDANRRRLVHGPLQPMDPVQTSDRLGARGLWQRLFRS